MVVVVVVVVVLSRGTRCNKNEAKRVASEDE